MAATHDHAGDPERSVRLLWHAGESADRPRTGLSLERIVQVAVELADTEGLGALSMRRVAERLGFTPMSLYRHVPGKAELVDLMCEAVTGEVPTPPADSGWRVGLESWAREGLALYQRHPWLVQLRGARTVPGPNTIADFDAALRTVAGIGLPPNEMVAVVQLVGGFVGSAAWQAVETAQTERRTGVTDEAWWGARDSLFDRVDDTYPTLTEVWESGGYDDPVDPFEFGLQRVLDGVEALVRSRTATPAFRDEIHDEIMRCVTCGNPVTQSERGRPRAYCSRACQQRAYRSRKAPPR